MLSKIFLDEQVRLYFKAHKYGGITPAVEYLGFLIDISDGLVFLKESGTDKMFVFPLSMVLYIEFVNRKLFPGENDG
jgi:hypothetical protein